jgi:hypothetical protein
MAARLLYNLRESAIAMESPRYGCAIAAKALGDRLAIVLNSLCNRFSTFAIAAQSIRNHSEVAVQSIRSRQIAARSLHNQLAMIAQIPSNRYKIVALAISIRNRCEITNKSLINRFEIASKLLRIRFAIAFCNHTLYFLANLTQPLQRSKPNLIPI